MKRFLSLLFVTVSYFASAQNYQCLQSGVKHFFINGNNYLRGIRIDSTRTTGDTTIYYPFHTPRGQYNTSMAVGNPVLDTNGGSWLGKKVLQLSDGTFIFDSYWNDSVIIKTQANVGDSWVFYHDSSNIYYKATVVSMDTMSVLSAVDSVKNVMINAYDSTGLVPTDPLDSFTFILSKHYGFVQVFDLYTFPYHKLDSVYRPGLDFFLDRSLCTLETINGNPSPPIAPNSNVALFKLTDFIIPNEQQLHNWQVGDVIGSTHSYGVSGLSGYPCVTEYILDTVTSEVVSGHTKSYTLSGMSPTCDSFPSLCIYAPFTCYPIYYPGTFSFSDIVYPIVDISYIPEHDLKISGGIYVFYYPNDTGFCSIGPTYKTTGMYYFTAGLGGGYENADYKFGVGETFYVYQDGNPTYESTTLTKFSCSPLEISNVSSSPNSIRLFPNPATTVVAISSPQEITNITIINLLGQLIYARECDTEKVQLDISAWPAGIYFVRINGTEVKKFIKE